MFRKVFPNTLESRNGKLDPTYEEPYNVVEITGLGLERKSMNMKTSFNKVECNSFKEVLLLIHFRYFFYLNGANKLARKMKYNEKEC